MSSPQKEFKSMSASIIVQTPSSRLENLSASRIPLEDIVAATENFAEENLLTRDEHTSVFKGLLPWGSQVWINVVIRRYMHKLDLYEFCLQIEGLYGYVHKNKVFFIGFCDEKDEQMIVTEHVVNGSLDKYLSDPIFLTWLQRLHICFGAALGLNYINSPFRGFKIFLDKNWEAKVLIFPSEYYIKNKKYDALYCLGVLLLEVLYGRNATVDDVNQYLTINHYEQLDDVIVPNLRKQMHPQSLSIFSELAYDCFNEQPDQQITNLYETVERLYEAVKIQWKHENHVGVVKQARKERSKFNRDISC